MSAEDIERFEAAGGDLLDELSYARSRVPSFPRGSSRRRQGFVPRSPTISVPTGHRLPECRRNPYVFIVGGARSGTTLLQRMVDADPDIAVIHESHWISRFYEERIGLTPDGMVTKDLASKLLDDRRFIKLGLDHNDL